jgi:hypothetical protein
MAPLCGRLVRAGELMLEVDPDRARYVACFERSLAIATVEVPANIGQHCVGMCVDELGVDEGWDH